jgi:transcriptional regulator with XRE-family HTH domain
VSDERTNRAKRIAKLIEQTNRSVQAAIAGTRKDKGLNQEDAAERMAWTVNIMSNIEQGRREITVSELIVLAREIDVDPEVLFKRVLRW